VVTKPLENIRRIAELLRQTTSLSVVRNYFKEKGLTFSGGGWEDFTEKRIVVQHDEGSLTTKDLLKILGTAEIYGKQHIFLFDTPQARVAGILDRARVESVLKRRKLGHLIEASVSIDTPDEPTFVAVEWSGSGKGLSLTIKEVYPHRVLKLAGEDQTALGVVKRWEYDFTRAVNVARLHQDGVLEVRLASVGEASYKDKLNDFLARLGELVPIHEFNVTRLDKAKTALREDQVKLRPKIRFSDTIMRNENGITVKVTTGSSEDDLADDEGAQAGQDAFMNHNNAYTQGHNFWFRAVQDKLAKEILILLNGEPNEFAVMANCSESDYEYVLRELRALNI
jgi:hypothetical protein